MNAVVADTHAIIWYLTDPTKLSSSAVAAFDGATTSGDPIFVPTISLVELCYLVEKGKLPETTMTTVLGAFNLPYTPLELMPLTPKIALTLRRISRDIVPDMPDRIIAATALELGLPLVTRDHKIIASGIPTIW
jgi:PIN domain nuclease of toxin-antitoxin system